MTARRPTKVAAINCPIDLFSSQEAEMVQLTQHINQARTAAAKVPAALSLMKIADVLLACHAYDEQHLDCRLCREFAQLRRKTAGIIVEAANLPAHRR
jgi:hypothetical protein